jgi:hypothetical protein
MLNCSHCGVRLTAQAEKDHGEWVVRCFSCGVVNIIRIRYALEIVGFR